MGELDPETIGKRLELLRESKGLSQRQMAKEIHMAQSAISDFEAGKRLPSTKALNKLLSFFEIQASELIGSANNDPVRAKRQFLIQRVVDKLETLSVEEISVIGQLIDRLSLMQRLGTEPKGPGPSNQSKRK